MEYLPYPNLAEVFLFRNIGANHWENIINSIFKIYSSFYLKNNYKVSYYNVSNIYSKKLEKKFIELIEIIKKSNNKFLIKILESGTIVNKNYLPALQDTFYAMIKKLNLF